MRLIAVLLAAVVLAAAPSLEAAQQAQVSSPQTSPSASKDDQTIDLPVSVDKIRKALLQMPPAPLKGLDVKPTFRVEVQERNRLQDLMSTLKFDSGPPIPGGLYAYEQQQSMWPKVQNPLVQPYSAFSQGELAQVLITSLLERYFAGRVANSISDAERSHAEAAARQEVARAIAEYCDAQPGHGAGIQICATSPAIR